MKPAKVNSLTLIGLFCSVGLVADLLPCPALHPGLVVSTINRLAVIISVNPEPQLKGKIAMTHQAE